MDQNSISYLPLQKNLSLQKKEFSEEKNELKLAFDSCVNQMNEHYLDISR